MNVVLLVLLREGTDPSMRGWTEQHGHAWLSNPSFTKPYLVSLLSAEGDPSEDRGAPVAGRAICQPIRRDHERPGDAALLPPLPGAADHPHEANAGHGSGNQLADRNAS